jgi:hypothetical protein
MPVTVSVGQLTRAQIDAALASGLARAQEYQRRGLILDAAMMLRGQVRTLNHTDHCSPELVEGGV